MSVVVIRTNTNAVSVTANDTQPSYVDQITTGTVSVNTVTSVVTVTPIAQGAQGPPGPPTGVQSVTGDGVGGTASNVVMTFPTVNDIGAYSNTNPSAFINVAGAPVQSVNGDVGTVVLDANDVGAYSNTNPLAFINIGAVPIKTVTGQGVDNSNVGNVVVSFPTIDQIGAYSNTNPSGFITSAGAPVQSVTGTQVTGTSANPVVNLPTINQIGAYSNTNPSAFINVAQAPVQSVNGDTGIVVLNANDVGAYSNTNPNNFINSAGAPVQSVNGDTGAVVLALDDIDDVNVAGVTNGQSLVYNATATEWQAQTITGGGGAVDSVNGQTGVVVLNADDVGAYSNTNPNAFVNVAQASAAAPVQSVNGDTGNVTVYNGGNTSDILVKLSGTDYDTAWTDEITVDRVSYDITAGETLTDEGQTAWDADARTLAINKGGGVVQNITQDLNYPPARNTEATALVRGELVMVDPSQPAQGQTLRLKRYVSDGTYPVDLFVGMVSEVIQPNETGFVEWFGQLRNLSLPALEPVGETWAEGDILWPNPSVAGGMTKVEPTAPAHKVTVAAILRINGNNINLLLRPNMRSRIVDLHDVQVTNASNAQVLTYQNGVWVNATNPADGVQSVTGDGVGGTATNVVMTFPTVNQIGAYSNTNPSAFINVAQAPVQSVNGQTNVVVLGANDVGAYSNTNPSAFINIAQASSAAPIQTVTGDGVDNSNVGNVVISFPTLDDIGAYSNTNPANYINVAQASAAAPVQSVNGQTNVVVLDADDVGAYSNTNPSAFINVAQAPVQSVNGDTGIVVITANSIGAYLNTNPNNFINSAQAPVQSVNGDTGVVVLALDDINDVNISGVTNGQSLVYNATATEWRAVTISGGGGAVDSVNGQTGVVVLDADDVGAYSNTNPSAFINVAQAPVQSVNGSTGIVVITANSIGAYLNTNPNAFVNIAQVPIKTVTGDGVDNTNVGNVVISYPSIDDIGAYSNTNPSAFINVAGAPVQSVNGQTNVVVLDADDVGAYSNTNPLSFVDATGADILRIQIFS